VRDRDLVRVYWPAELCAAFDALFAIDGAMEDVVARATQPALGAIKLAWWRERLEELDQGRVPAEPRLRAAASELLPRGVTGIDLAELEMGWATLLDERPDPASVGARGVQLFEIAARLLGAEDRLLANAGWVYAAMSAARLGHEPSPNVIIPLLEPLRGHRTPKQLRPITGLARLAARDFRHGKLHEAEGSRRRAVALLAHRWTGRIL
jgi:15-cis-phytoene synthase